MKIHLLLFLSLICVSNMFGQIVLKGSIKDEEGNVVPFASVALLSEKDSMNIEKSDIADAKGMYRFGNLQSGGYVIVASFVGYGTVKENIKLRMPTGTNVITRDFTLSTISHDLAEVTVKGNRKAMDIGKSTHTFTSAQVKAARHAADLLENVEDLTTDIQSGKITRMNGSNVKILINGVSATSTDLKSIPAGKIQKVVYYNVPPMKYFGSSIVVDVITKRLDTGVTGGLELSHAISTGFFNDNVYLRHVSGNSQLSLDYTVNFRNYTKRYNTDTYQYLIGDDEISQFFNTHDKFGYTEHSPNIKYTYQIEGKSVFQLSMSPSFQTRFNKGTGEVTTLYNTGLNSLGTRSIDNAANTFSPSLDLYYSKKISERHEFSSNLLGTYFYSHQNKTYKENGGNMSSVLEDEMTQRTNKYSVIAEISDDHKYLLGEFNVGAKFILSKSSSTIKNALSDYSAYKYVAENRNIYLYGEYKGFFKNYMYQISIGGTYVWQGNDLTKYHKILFTPRLVVARKFGNAHLLQYQLLSNSISPTVTQLSNNSEYVTSFLLHVGNPYLKNELNISQVLSYNVKCKSVDFSIAAVYDYSDNPIVYFYDIQSVNGTKKAVCFESNANGFTQYGGFYSASFKPIRDMLTFRLYGLCLRQHIETKKDICAKNWYTPLFYQMSLQLKNWNLNYKGSIVSSVIEHAQLKRDENVSQFNIAYQYRNWRFNIGCLWMFTKSKYRYELLPNNVVSNVSSSYINDNRSMVVFGISWNLQKGKNISLKKKINNKDSDDGLF